MSNNTYKLILLVLVMIFAIFLQLTTNEIHPSIMTIIIGFLSALIGISITPNDLDDKE